MHKLHKDPVYINAVSTYTCLGDSTELTNAIYTSKTGIKPDATIPGKNVCLGKFTNLKFNDALSLVCNEILEQIDKKDFSKTLLLVGSSVGGMPTSEEHFFKDKSYKNIRPQEHGIQSIGHYLNEKFHFSSVRSYSTACTSSANALMIAKRLIEISAYSSILVIGADALCMTTIFGFDSLKILSEDVCRPFDKNRSGMNVAEGIGAIYLEDKPTSNSIVFLGAAGSSDAYHIANPDPSSSSSMRAMEEALIDAKLHSSDIDYINAHGTGTVANDKAEANAMMSLFQHLPFVSSTKGLTGHTLGAAGAIEAAICVNALLQQKLPINANLIEKDSDLNLVTSSTNHKITYAMSNSFAFGGNNTSLIFGALS
jgi:3-oxoacyl-[acyl-carrier-protein] synthase I